MDQPEVFSLKQLIKMVEEGERMIIQANQFFAFMEETELLRIPFCIKSSVVGGQVALERWDIGGLVGVGRNRNEKDLH